ncbi:peptidoglycan-binding protein [Streptomyces sp. ISL-10]|nr:peptidoglycan-binding protein [Streptomyces sp. ISL-10]
MAAVTELGRAAAVDGRGDLAKEDQVVHTTPVPSQQPFPWATCFVPGRRSELITPVGERLVAERCGRYAVGHGPVWGRADVLSYAAWQRRLGYTVAAADGSPGRSSWDRLRVPRTGRGAAA